MVIIFHNWMKRVGWYHFTTLMCSKSSGCIGSRFTWVFFYNKAWFSWWGSHRRGRRRRRMKRCFTWYAITSYSNIAKGDVSLWWYEFLWIFLWQRDDILLLVVVFIEIPFICCCCFCLFLVGDLFTWSLFQRWQFWQNIFYDVIFSFYLLKEWVLDQLFCCRSNMIIWILVVCIY